MTDTKRNHNLQKKKVVKGRTRRVWSTTWIHQAPTDSLSLVSSWDAGLLSTGTTGVIATTIVCSFATSATEYSPISSLFSEIKLKKAVLVISPINPRSTTNIHGKINIGWSPIINATTAVNPSGFSNVINLAGWKNITTGNVNASEVPAYTNNHVWQIVTSTNPPIDSGDCGGWVVYSDTLTNSTNYFSCQVHAHYVFKGRL
jgi:hypothetical protein